MYNQNIMEKVTLVREGNEIRLHIPFEKVDVENRRVFGFATIDSVDRHGEVITAEASAAAFSAFTGGLREMHQPLAVGKVVSFQQEDIYDPESDKVYNGIFVETYVSKGAQDTWEKVLDGTLKGFSIGGETTNTAEQYNPDDDKFVRYITGYNLFELSLVDNPANPLATVLSFQKNSDVVTGIAVDVDIDNVFWCENDRISTTSKEETMSCVKCAGYMENLGWVESGSIQKMKDLVRTKKLQKSETEGGTTEMADTKTEVQEATPDAGTTEIAGAANENAVVTTDDVKETDEEKAEKVEKAEEESTSEVTNELDLVKMNEGIAGIQELLKGFETRETERAAELTAVKDSVAGLEKSVTEKHAELEKAFEDFKATVTTVEKRVDDVENSAAIKKSVDTVAEPVKNDKRSVFTGAFLPGNAE